MRAECSPIGAVGKHQIKVGYGKKLWKQDTFGSAASTISWFDLKKKKIEKLKYIYRNPVKRGLVLEPDQWAWSSFRCYAHGERGPVLVNERRRAEMKMRNRETFVA